MAANFHIRQFSCQLAFSFCRRSFIIFPFHNVSHKWVCSPNKPPLFSTLTPFFSPASRVILWEWICKAGLVKERQIDSDCLGGTGSSSVILYLCAIHHLPLSRVAILQLTGHSSLSSFGRCVLVYMRHSNGFPSTTESTTNNSHADRLYCTELAFIRQLTITSAVYWLLRSKKRCPDWDRRREIANLLTD